MALGLQIASASAQRRDGRERGGRASEVARSWEGAASSGREGYRAHDGYSGYAGYGGFAAGDRGYGSPNQSRYAYAPAERRVWGRGQVLPFDYRGAEVADPGRYHLRRPPAGFGWVGDGRNAYLMQRSTGMVLDSVPRAYEPAPAARRPRR